MIATASPRLTSRSIASRARTEPSPLPYCFRRPLACTSTVEDAFKTSAVELLIAVFSVSSRRFRILATSARRLVGEGLCLLEAAPRRIPFAQRSRLGPHLAVDEAGRGVVRLQCCWDTRVISAVRA